MACSRDPGCLEGHEGMVFEGTHWRDPEKYRASVRRYRASHKWYVVRAHVDTRRKRQRAEAAAIQLGLEHLIT